MLQFWGKDLTRSAPSNGPLFKLMSEKIIPGNEGAGELWRLLRQYGCGPIQFAGTSDALYERHLIFDNVVDPATAHPRERFEAIARSVRDVLSQRWVHTERSYERENPKRIYYLSMEFLLGRSLANNLTNLLLDSVAKAGGRAEESGVARTAGAGTRCRSRKRWSRAPGRLLS